MSLEEIELYFEAMYGPHPSILNNKEHKAIKKLIAVAETAKEYLSSRAMLCDLRKALDKLEEE